MMAPVAEELKCGIDVVQLQDVGERTQHDAARDGSDHWFRAPPNKLVPPITTAAIAVSS